MKVVIYPILVLAALFLSVPPLYSLDSPNGGSLSISYKDDMTILVLLRHLEGQDQIILERVFPASEPSHRLNGTELQAPVHPLLYRGRLRRSGKDGAHMAAASVINGKLKVSFHGRRRGRFITISKKLTARSSTAQVRFVASFSKFKCGAVGGANSLLQLEEDFSANAATTQSRELSISADADYEFYSKYESGTFAEIEDIFNTVNGIYMNQLGIDLSVNEIKAHSASSQPYTESIGESLLREFRNYNNANDRLKSADVYHLFTGKTLEPIGMVGLSYVGAICQENGTYSYGMTAYYPSAVQPIITAHEIAHGLGATHTSSGIMLANLSSNPRTFSTFSVEEISDYVNSYGSCLSLASPVVSLQKVSYSSKGRFRATLAPGGALSGECEMALYGSNKSAYLSAKKIFKKARRLAAYTVSSAEEKKRLSATIVPNSKKKRPIYIRAAISCTTGKAYSKTKTLLVKSRSLSGFFTALAAALAE